MLEARRVLFAERITVVEGARRFLGVSAAVEDEAGAARGRHAVEPERQVEKERERPGDHRCLRHQLPRKFIAPTMAAASTMKRPSSSMPSMVLSVSSSAEKSRGSIQS